LTAFGVIPRSSSRRALSANNRRACSTSSLITAISYDVDVLAYFDRAGTSNGPTEAIN
jgi:transposase